MLFHQVNHLYKQEKRGPKTEPCGTPAVTFSHDEIRPFKINFVDALLTKLLIISKDFPSAP